MNENGSPNRDVILQYLNDINTLTVDKSLHVILNAFSIWGSGVDSPDLREVSQQWIKKDEFWAKRMRAGPLSEKDSLGVYINYLIVQYTPRYHNTIEQRKYQRMEAPEHREVYTEDYSDQIAAYALNLSFEEALGFFGELTGAWMLTVPEKSIRKDRTFIEDESHWVKTDDDLIYVMDKWFTRTIMLWL